jgi:tRNA(Ile)-lysidine synthase
MIDVTRAQVEAFCKALRLRPLRDPANENREFLRNQVRHETLPYLRATINAGLPDALIRVADIFRDEDSYLDTQAGLGAPSALDADGAAARLELDRLKAIHPALQRRAIRMLTWTFDGTVHTAAHVERARALALEGKPGAGIDLPEGLRVSVEYGYLVVSRTPPHPPPAGAIPLEVPGETEPEGWDLRVRSWIGEERPAGWPDGRTTCVMDADRAAFPLRVRRWRPGDRFRPLGMSSAKKVGDFFTDGRVPKRERGRAPLVVDARDRVVWVVGHRIDDRMKVTDDTRRFLWIEA